MFFAYEGVEITEERGFIKRWRMTSEEVSAGPPSVVMHEDAGPRG